MISMLQNNEIVVLEHFSVPLKRKRKKENDIMRQHVKEVLFFYETG